LFLAVFVGLFAWMLASLRAVTSNRTAIALAFLFCVATSTSRELRGLHAAGRSICSLFGASLGAMRASSTSG
jgi:hypothetical protein